MQSNGEFSKFVNEYGSKEQEEKKEIDDDEDAPEGDPDNEKKRRKAVAGAGIMQAEERNTGAISSKTYKSYLEAGNGQIVIPILIFSVVFMQGATVMSSYWYVLDLLVVLGLILSGLCTGRSCACFSLFRSSPFS